jgi:hypothetical protein
VPPKKSPMTLPMPLPQAPAGPKRYPNTRGTATAGRSSVKPGMIGIGLKGISSAA